MVSADKFDGGFSTTDDSYTQACAADKTKKKKIEFKST